MTASTIWPPRTDREHLDDLVKTVTVAADDRAQRPVLSPYSGENVGSVPDCTADDVELAVSRARKAQREWADRDPAERAAVFTRYHDMVLNRQDELLDVMQLESGKARRHAFEEVLDVANTARHYAHRAEGYLKDEERKGGLPLLTKTHQYRHPIGVVGIISPWNYPLTLAVSDAIPALLAGNSVVLKPAEETPYTALLAVKLLREAGIPPNVFQVVTGSGSKLGPALVDDVDFVQFTGSTETGRKVAEQAGRNLVPSSLELGGKNPMVVFDDADMTWAVDGAIRGCFTNAGQLCIAFERLYVQSGVYEEFRDKLVNRTRSLQLAASYDHDAEVGSLMGEEQLQKVQDHVDDAVEKGAKVLTGGRHRPDLGPYFFEPTILEGVTDDMKVAREETFGPVVTLRSFRRDQEAIELANDSEYGLNAAIWTEDTERGRDVARQIECGTVNLNDPYTAAWGSVDAPMGGMKQSGLGRRHGAEGFLKYTQTQTVAEQRIHPIAPPRPIPMRLYAKGMSAILKVMRRIPGLR
ncbi:succinic semialdehyde dehydrogenase [Haladaptatus sp. YSMS36]|uniref:succinic semialdehyde dehydrogenase n=1 Tax=Haladaptatus sp. YSMS36 TaxID=3033384 RepID=UPI0023E8A1C0|nr:succinic semialdehyde dehydrogenase [Haladaptatus sp. YSMS36]